MTSLDPPAGAPPTAARRPSRARRLVLLNSLALPSFGWTLLFFLAPLALLTVFSFGQMNIITFEVEFGWTFENYTRIADSLYLNTIFRSFAMSAGATVACLVIGYPVAYAIARRAGRMQTLLLVAVMVPFWTSFVVRTYAWANLLANDGPIAHVLEWLGLSDGTLNILYTPYAVSIGIVYTYLPLMILSLFVALERIDPELLLAASDLGASRFRMFRRVILPLSMPGVIAGCIIVGIPATGEYTIPAILGGDKTLMYGNVVADQFLKVGDYPFGSALTITLMAALTVLLVFGRSRLARAEEVA